MALIVEDGSLVENATSYASFAEADAYLVPRSLWEATPDEGQDADGAASITAKKEAALIRAFDALNRLRWLGLQVATDCVKAWPRWNVPSGAVENGAPVFLPSDSIPACVKQAQMEMAALIYAGSYDPAAPVEHGGKVLSTSESASTTVDVISKSSSKSVTYAEGAAVESYLPSVYGLLQGLLADTPGIAQGLQCARVARG